MARPKYPSDSVDKTMVRFPDGLMPKIKEVAAQNNRSMNAEIVARLEASFDKINRISPEEADELRTKIYSLAQDHEQHLRDYEDFKNEIISINREKAGVLTTQDPAPIPTKRKRNIKVTD